MASRHLVVHVVGARPNYMKVAPVYDALERLGNVDQRLIHTGQHYDAIMKDVFFAELPLPKPHVQLDARTTEDALAGARARLRRTAAGTRGRGRRRQLDARRRRRRAKHGIPVCHIESGLRSDDWSMPEERNRVITDHLSALLLTHSDEANKNLGAEGLADEDRQFVGNTMIDTLRANEDAAVALEAWREFGFEPGGYVLVTLHRPSLVDVADLLARTMAALEHLAESLPVIFPVHPRTRQNLAARPDSPNGTAAVPAVSLPRSQSRRGRDRLRRDPGRDDGAPCSLLHSSRQHRTAVTIELGTNTLLGLEPERLREVPTLLSDAEPRADPAALGWAGRTTSRRSDRRLTAWRCGLKVWVDMTASAHVLVFRPLIKLLRERGDEVEITARDYAQTLQLLELHGLEATVVGRHGGRSRLGKARSLASRLRALRKWARPRDFDLALAHGSHELTLTARRLGIPSATTHDYEFAMLQHHLGMRAATKVVVPDSIPDERLAHFGVKPPKLLRYPGLKEEYYLADFEPDAGVLGQLGVDRDRVLVVLRPPPDVSLYHRHSNPLFPQTLAYLGDSKRCTPSCCRAPTTSASTCAGSRCPR